jgi:hypothetical protein
MIKFGTKSGYVSLCSMVTRRRTRASIREYLPVKAALMRDDLPVPSSPATTIQVCLLNLSMQQKEETKMSDMGDCDLLVLQPTSLHS